MKPWKIEISSVDCPNTYVERCCGLDGRDDFANWCGITFKPCTEASCPLKKKEVSDGD